MIKKAWKISLICSGILNKIHYLRKDLFENTHHGKF